MEPLFENRYIRDEALIREFYRRILLLSPIYIFGYLYIAHILFEFIFVWIFFGYCDLSYPIIAIGLLGFLWILYRQNVRLSLDRDLELNGGKSLAQHYVVTENSLICSGPNSSSEIPLERIKKVRRTKHLILVWTKAKYAIIFPKASFTKGSPEEFLAFLKARGIK